MKDVIKLYTEDTVELKKQHPCGGKEFKIVRLGSDVKLICITCGRDILLPRIKLEKQIKKVIRTSEDQ